MVEPGYIEQEAFRHSNLISGSFDSYGTGKNSNTIQLSDQYRLEALHSVCLPGYTVV